MDFRYISCGVKDEKPAGIEDAGDKCGEDVPGWPARKSLDILSVKKEASCLPVRCLKKRKVIVSKICGVVAC